MAEVMDYDMNATSSSGGGSYPLDEWFDGKTRRIFEGEDYDIKTSSMRSRLQNDWNNREVDPESEDYMVNYCVTSVIRVNKKAGIEFQAVQFTPDSEEGRNRIAYRANLKKKAELRRGYES